MKEGDVVRLRSGGPYMTLVSRTGEDARPGWTCVWFTQDAETRSSAFLESLLVTYDEATGAAPPGDEAVTFADEEAPPAPAQTWKQKRGLT